jgi:NADH:ubiquinone oxidoreductase subunit 4 (subunit M)
MKNAITNLNKKFGGPITKENKSNPNILKIGVFICLSIIMYYSFRRFKPSMLLDEDKEFVKNKAIAVSIIISGICISLWHLSGINTTAPK